MFDKQVIALADSTIVLIFFILDYFILKRFLGITNFKNTFQL